MGSTNDDSRAPQGARGGFSLIEIGVVLVIISILVGYGLSIATATAEREAITVTRDRLEAIEDALILYATRNKRLPCPADGTLADDDAAAGVEDDGGADGDPAGNETLNCGTGIGISVVPWRTLGLPQQVAIDGWRRRISYFVFDGADGVSREDGLDMTACISAEPIPAELTDGNDANDAAAAEPDCTPNPDPIHPSAFVVTKGLQLLPENGDNMAGETPLMDPADWEAGGGAAFVLISHGLDGAGAHLRSGARLAVPPAAQRLQRENTDDDDDFTLAPYADGQGTPDVVYFDDHVRAMTIHAIADDANLGPQ